MAERAGSGAWTTRCSARTSRRCTRSSACGWRTRASCWSRPPTSSSSSWPRSWASRAGWSTTARSTSSPGPPGTPTPSTASCASTGRCACVPSAAGWLLPFAVVSGGRAVGVVGLGAPRWPGERVVDTRAWIARTDQGHGLGRRCRAMLLELAFAHLGASRAVTAASRDNAASRAVSQAAGLPGDRRDPRARRRPRGARLAHPGGLATPAPARRGRRRRGAVPRGPGGLTPPGRPAYRPPGRGDGQLLASLERRRRRGDRDEDFRDGADSASASAGASSSRSSASSSPASSATSSSRSSASSASYVLDVLVLDRRVLGVGDVLGLGDVLGGRIGVLGVVLDVLEEVVVTLLLAELLVGVQELVGVVLELVGRDVDPDGPAADDEGAVQVDRFDERFGHGCGGPSRGARARVEGGGPSRGRPVSPGGRCAMRGRWPSGRSDSGRCSRYAPPPGGGAPRIASSLRRGAPAPPAQVVNARTVTSVPTAVTVR